MGTKDAVMGQRERRKIATREALETAALRLFVRDGFDHTTVDDIAAAADVARRTFFRYFESKEAVVFARSAEQLELLKLSLQSRPVDEPVLTAIRAAILDLSASQEDDRDRQLVRATITVNAPSVQAHGALLTAEWSATIAAFVRERLDASLDDMRPDTIAGATVGALGGAMGRWVAGGGLEDSAELVNHAMDLLENGFGLAGGDD